MSKKVFTVLVCTDCDTRVFYVAGDPPVCVNCQVIALKAEVAALDGLLTRLQERSSFVLYAARAGADEMSGSLEEYEENMQTIEDFRDILEGRWGSCKTD